MNLEDCLPSELRSGATITRIAAGMSGAGVYRVEQGERVYVLKLAADSESELDWRRTVQIQRLAANAGLSPRIVHVDEARRAVVTEFVVDRSFTGYYRNPATHGAALAKLGETVRRIHALPLPSDSAMRDPHAFLMQTWGGLQGFAVPAFARELIERTIAEPPGRSERPPVLCHNDLNPTNLVYDGESIVLLDWAAAGANDALYDLGVLSVFLRMDEATTLGLLSAYEEAAQRELPPRFRAMRRLVAVLAGTMQLFIARQMKHPGANGSETVEGTLALGDFYQRLMTGSVKMGTPEGQWAFGLALLKDA